jgi:hypothetical protein
VASILPRACLKLSCLLFDIRQPLLCSTGYIGAFFCLFLNSAVIPSFRHTDIVLCLSSRQAYHFGCVSAVRPKRGRAI